MDKNITVSILIFSLLIFCMCATSLEEHGDLEEDKPVVAIDNINDTKHDPVDIKPSPHKGFKLPTATLLIIPTVFVCSCGIFYYRRKKTACMNTYLRHNGNIATLNTPEALDNISHTYDYVHTRCNTSANRQVLASSTTRQDQHQFQICVKDLNTTLVQMLQRRHHYDQIYDYANVANTNSTILPQNARRSWQHSKNWAQNHGNTELNSPAQAGSSPMHVVKSISGKRSQTLTPSNVQQCHCHNSTEILNTTSVETLKPLNHHQTYDYVYSTNNTSVIRPPTAHPSKKQNHDNTSKRLESLRDCSNSSPVYDYAYARNDNIFAQDTIRSYKHHYKNQAPEIASTKPITPR